MEPEYISHKTLFQEYKRNKEKFLKLISSYLAIFFFSEIRVYFLFSLVSTLLHTHHDVPEEQEIAYMFSRAESFKVIVLIYWKQINWLANKYLTTFILYYAFFYTPG